MLQTNFKTFLDEKRSHAEQNPKISVYEALKPYATSDHHYISFTEIEKLGINPQSKFNTPLGIYCYPLKEVWEYYDVDKFKTLKGLPFAADRPYVWLIEANIDKDGEFIDDMYSDYGSNRFDADEDVLAQIWREEILNNKQFAINSYSYMTGKNDDDITDSELKFDLWAKVYTKALRDAKAKNAVMSFWNLSRMMAMYLSNGEDRGIKPATKWNKLLRTCGYTGFADKTGRGYIHPSEPMQAVFLTTKAFTVVDKIMNKDYKNKDEANQEIRTLLDINKYITEHDETTEAFLYFLTDHMDSYIGDHAQLPHITLLPLSFIYSADYEHIKEFLFLCLRYVKLYKVFYEEAFVTYCRVIRSKYTLHENIPKDSNQWNMLNNVINKIAEELGV